MAIIHIVGLGPGDIDSLPLGTYRLLQSGLPVFLRTAVHPVVEQLRSDGIRFSSFDDLYETNDVFDNLYQEMADRLRERASALGEIIYGVPGHPLMAEQSVQNIIRDAGDIDIRITGAQSFVDAVCASLRIDPIDGLLLLDGTALHASQLDPRVHTLIAQTFNLNVASEVKLTLMEVYPDDYSIQVVRAAGVDGVESVEEVPLYELDRGDVPLDHLSTLHIPPAKEDKILVRDPWTVAGLVKRLRAPGGCPWDRKQTHESLRPYVLEEAYEVAHAIDGGDAVNLAEELGDLLLQVLLHSEIASETGEFDIRDVYAALGDKLIRRHPHVFGGQAARTEEDAQTLWADAKRRESRKTGSMPSLLDGIDMGRPAHHIAMDLQKRAAGAGFDWEDVQGVLEKLKEELQELESEVSGESAERIQDELGDVVFSIINLSRWLNADCDAALAHTNAKFQNRFRYVEQRVQESGEKWGEIELESMERFWREAKQQE